MILKEKEFVEILKEYTKILKKRIDEAFPQEERKRQK